MMGGECNFSGLSGRPQALKMETANTTETKHAADQKLGKAPEKAPTRALEEALKTKPTRALEMAKLLCRCTASAAELTTVRLLSGRKKPLCILGWWDEHLC